MVPEMAVIILIVTFTFRCLGNLLWCKLSAFVTDSCMPILCWILYDTVCYDVYVVFWQLSLIPLSDVWLSVSEELFEFFFLFW